MSQAMSVACAARFSAGGTVHEVELSEEIKERKEK